MNELEPDAPELEGFDQYAKQQMILIAKELNNLQLSYDTKLLAALLAG